MATTSGTFRHEFDTNSTLTRHYLVVKKLPVVSMSRCRQSLRPGWHWHQSPWWCHGHHARPSARNVEDLVVETATVARDRVSLGTRGTISGAGVGAWNVENIVFQTAATTTVAGDRVSLRTMRAMGSAGVGEGEALIAFTERYASARYSSPWQTPNIDLDIGAQLLGGSHVEGDLLAILHKQDFFVTLWEHLARRVCPTLQRVHSTGSLATE